MAMVSVSYTIEHAVMFVDVGSNRTVLENLSLSFVSSAMTSVGLGLYVSVHFCCAGVQGSG